MQSMHHKMQLKTFGNANDNIRKGKSKTSQNANPKHPQIQINNITKCKFKTSQNGNRQHHKIRIKEITKWKSKSSQNANESITKCK
jgi:hypothetical protein